MLGAFRVLVGEDGPEVVGFLRLVLLRTDGGSTGEAMVRRPGARDDPLRQALGRSFPADCGAYPPSVLVVQDGPDELAALTAYFHRAGCTVTGVAIADRALALAPNLHPDLIVIDPGTLGRELTNQLTVRYPHCQIAVTTVLDVHHDRGQPNVSSRTDHPAAASLR